jgi:hypothetical protein
MIKYADTRRKWLWKRAMVAHIIVKRYLNRSNRKALQRKARWTVMKQLLMLMARKIISYRKKSIKHRHMRHCIQTLDFHASIIYPGDMHSALNNIIKPTFDELINQIRMKTSLNEFKRKIILI